MRRQGGAAGIRQLREAGLSPEVVAGLVRRRIIARRHRGVYVSALAPLTPKGHLFAALLACNDTAFVSHGTAAALHGLRPLNLRAIEVTVIADHTPRHCGFIVHRTRRTPLPGEVRAIGDMRVASPTRALLDVAATATDRELRRLIAEAARRRQLDLARIDASIAHRPRAPGVAALIEALRRYRPDSVYADKSRLERDVAQLLAENPEIPPARRNVLLDNRFELDFFWPEHRLALEIDGEPYHLTPDELERDRLKDAYLQRHGIRVLRVTGFRFDHDRSGILDDLRHFTKSARAA